MARSSKEEEAIKEKSRQRVQLEADREEELDATDFKVRMNAQAEYLKLDLQRLKETMKGVGGFGVFRQLPNSNLASTRAIQAFVDDDDSYYRLFRMPAKRRMLFVPRRHIGWATWSILENILPALRNATTALVAFPTQGLLRQGPAGVAKCIPKGIGFSALYLGLGFVVSPLWHLTHGLINNLFGLPNSYFSWYYYDPVQGFYKRTALQTTAAQKAEIEKQIDRIITIGTRDVEIKKRKAANSELGQLFEQQVKQTVNNMGKKKGGFGSGKESDAKKHSTGDTGGWSFATSAKKNQQQAAAGGPDAGSGAGAGAGRHAQEDDYYAILQVKKSASPAEIKAAYQRLAKALHPDNNPQDYFAADKFHKLNVAYKTLSDPKLRRTYDLSGGRKFASGSAADGLMEGTIMETTQKLFGGVPFKQNFIGEMYRSVEHLRATHSCSISNTELEVLQVLRTRLLALRLAMILDGNVYDPHWDTTGQQPAASSGAANKSEKATSTGSGGQQKNSSADSSSSTAATATSPPGTIAVEVSPAFKKRCEALIQKLEKCSFGAELMYEIGGAYEVCARRYLKESPCFTPKVFFYQKALSGVSTWMNVWKAVEEDHSAPTVKHAVSIFDAEYENCMVDLHVVCRFASMWAVNDASMGKGPLPGTQEEKAWNQRRAATAATASNSGKPGVDLPIIPYNVARQRRLHALLYLAQQMKAKGRPWKWKRENAEELLHQLRVVARGDTNNSPLPPF
jgi:curved DNA-binding protein CbpA